MIIFSSIIGFLAAFELIQSLRQKSLSHAKGALILVIIFIFC